MTDPPRCRLMRLPPELRLRIYEYVLLPSPRFVVNGFCPSQTRNTLYPTSKEELPDEYAILGSTCFLRPSMTRFYTGEPCASIPKGEHNAQTAILSTSKEISKEATAVVYENTHAIHSLNYERGILRSTFPFWSGIAVSKTAHIKCLHLPITIGLPWGHEGLKKTFRLQDCCDFILERLPMVSTLSMHIDINLIQQPVLDASAFQSLNVLADRMQFKIDVHVVFDWSHNVPGWQEPIAAEDLEEPWPTSFDKKAESLREKLIQDLSSIFNAYGKTLRITEN